MSEPVDVRVSIINAAKALPRSYEVRQIHHALCDAGESVDELIVAASEALQSLEYVSRNHSEQVTGGFKREDDIDRLRAALARCKGAQP